MLCGSGMLTREAFVVTSAHVTGCLKGSAYTGLEQALNFTYRPVCQRNTKTLYYIQNRVSKRALMFK
jgi:hypothetical protein